MLSDYFFRIYRGVQTFATPVHGMAPMWAFSILQKWPKIAKMTQDDLLTLGFIWTARKLWTKRSLSFLKFIIFVEIQCESFLMESQMTRNLFSDFWGVGGARSPSQHFSIFSIGSPTSKHSFAHAKEIRKLISLKGHSMNPDSHCRAKKDFNGNNATYTISYGSKWYK